MALPSTGELSLSAIQTEFGGSNPIALSEYYAASANVPASGTIRFAHFYGQSAGYTFSATISANTTNYDIRAAAIAAGWNGTTKLIATITINSNIYVGSTSTGSFAMDSNSSGTFPTGSTISIVNNGYIVGKGGTGGAGASATTTTNSQSVGSAGSGTNGGKALKLRYAASITNNGTIGGGGGGGGGGGAAACYMTSSASHACAGGGGGGGGGHSISSGGNAGAISQGTGNFYAYVYTPAIAGSATGYNYGLGYTGGFGGGGASAGRYEVVSFKSTLVLKGIGGTGGTAGNVGSAGNAGGNGTDSDPDYNWTTSNGGGGGSGANYIEGSSFATWVVTGTRSGGAT